MYNKQFLELMFAAKLRALENHVKSIDSTSANNFLRIFLLDAKIDLMQELIDDLSLDVSDKKKPEVQYHTEF